MHLNALQMLVIGCSLNFAVGKLVTRAVSFTV